MIGAIFAGGYGKRLQSVSPDIPKVLLPLRDNYVILDHQLLDFKKADIREVYLLTGYKGELIESRYGNKWRGLKIQYLREQEPMGTLWALTNFFSKVDADILLRNGDTITDLDLKDFVKTSQQHRELVNMLVVRMRSPFGMVSIQRNIVTNFREKPLLHHYINGGTYFMKRGVKAFLNRKYAEKGLEESLFKVLATRREIRTFKYDGFWKPIDSVKDYEEIRELYLTREV